MLFVAFIVSRIIHATSVCAETHSVDLSQYWDSHRPLANPDKGWYHHYYDNRITSYLANRDEEITQITGMDHLYLRLAWSYLEPREGEFHWEVIDSVIQHWTEKGLGIAFRISCKESSTENAYQRFATPQWVMQAGARGGFYESGKLASPQSGAWEPDFGDPIFLEKLDRFLEAFASRYDGKPWVRYIDIGSIGDWGEGHLGRGSRTHPTLDTRKAHIDLHLKHFKHSQLTVTDDYVYDLRSEKQIATLHEYILKNGISYRDDSILVESLKWRPQTFSVSRPDFFNDVFPHKPTVLETGHMRYILRNKYWTGEDGTGLVEKAGMEGPEFLLGAIRTLHATYIGYHGHARHWWGREGNIAISNRLLNHCGYWYFPKTASFPSQAHLGQTCTVQVSWINKGVAPAYKPYQMHFLLEGEYGVHRTIIDANNQRWMPESTRPEAWQEEYRIDLPKELPPGRYKLSTKLHAPESDRTVELAVRNDVVNKAGYIELGAINLVTPE